MYILVLLNVYVVEVSINMFGIENKVCRLFIYRNTQKNTVTL